jgi:hypothetical protein
MVGASDIGEDVFRNGRPHCAQNGEACALSEPHVEQRCILEGSHKRVSLYYSQICRELCEKQHNDGRSIPPQANRRSFGYV